MNEDTEPKNNRGGKRPGAGRKKGVPNTNINPKKRERKPHKPSLSITGNESELNRLREKAKEANKNVSAFVLSSFNCLDSQN